MGLAWQKLPGRSTGLGTHRTAYDARGGMGGALGVLGVGYAGRSQRRMRRVNRSAARLSRGGIGDLRVECVKLKVQGGVRTCHCKKIRLVTRLVTNKWLVADLQAS